MEVPSHPLPPRFSYGGFDMNQTMHTELVKSESPPSSPSSSSLSSLSQELPSSYFLSPSIYPVCSSHNSITKRPAAELSADELINEAVAAPPKRFCWAVSGGAGGVDVNDLDSMLDLLLADSTALIACPAASDSLPESHCTDNTVSRAAARWRHMGPPAYSRHSGAVMSHPTSAVGDSLPELHCNEETVISPEQLTGTHDLPELGHSRLVAPAYARNGGTVLSCPTRATSMQVLNKPLFEPASSQQHQKWAGLTLTDIESALGISTLSTSSSSWLPLCRSSQFSITDILQQETSIRDSSTITKCWNLAMPPVKLEEASLEEDDKMCSWRKIVQKRNHMEPRYTVKIRCGEDAVSDGYRWRKYGQKSIKNSPFPRSYYRCSTGKCCVKKQVERCCEDAGVLLVSYEGIHLHHRPHQTSLHQLNPTTHHAC